MFNVEFDPTLNKDYRILCYLNCRQMAAVRDVEGDSEIVCITLDNSDSFWSEREQGYIWIRILSDKFHLNILCLEFDHFIRGQYPFVWGASWWDVFNI